MEENVQSPSSALDETIGAQMETALNTYLTTLVGKYACHLISKGAKNPKTGKQTRLLISDNFGTIYNIDAVVTNESIQPLILVEYEYARYKEHGQDKGSWVCTAHNAIRRRYASVRSSFAILAGSWSGSSIAMMQSNDVNLFVIPFDKITALLKKHEIKFDWGEKEREVASESWRRYAALTAEQKQEIAEGMIADILPSLEAAIEKTLDNPTPRAVDKVAIEIHTNIGEVRRFEFKDVEAALDFLEDFSFEEMLGHANSFTLFDKPEGGD